MAQIWLTYEEMAQTFGGTLHEARDASIENGWGRVKGRDGVVHVRLTPAMAHEYLLRRLTQAQIGDETVQTDVMVASLRALLPAPALARAA